MYSNDPGAKRLPHWVSLTEAAYLTGQSTTDLLLRIGKGQIRSKTIEGKGAPCHLLRTVDLFGGSPSGGAWSASPAPDAGWAAGPPSDPTPPRRGVFPRVAVALVVVMAASLAVPSIRGSAVDGLLAGKASKTGIKSNAWGQMTDDGSVGKKSGFLSNGQCKPKSKAKRCLAGEAAPEPSPSPEPSPNPGPSPSPSTSPSPSPSPSPTPSPSPSPSLGGVGPQASITCPSGAIYVAPGSDIQVAVNAHPPGTAFCLRAGVHRRSSAITPKTGNSFTGEYGAIVDGSGWSTTDTWQGLFRAHNQDIDDVTIRNLVIRNSPQRGIHALFNFSDRWVIENNNIHNNRIGITHANSFQIRRNLIRDNHQYGIHSFRSSGSVLEDNVLAFNAAGYKNHPGDSGTTKWALVTDTIVRRNLVHDNYWHGIWFDGFHTGILIEDNVLRDNGRSVPSNGIFHEIGGQTVIRRNTISGSHRGIFIANSHDTEVYGNAIRDNDRAIMLYQDGNRLSENDLYNNLIRDNIVRIPPSPIIAGEAGYGVTMWCSNLTSTQCSAYSTSRANRFRGNMYQVPDTSKQWWFWNLGHRTWSQWQGAGQDTTGWVQQL